MKRGPIIVHAVVVLAAELLLLAAVIASGPSVAAALLAGAGLIAFAIEDMWLFMRMQSREKALIALVKKCAMDQERAYFEPLVPADVLAAAGLEKEGRS